MNITHITKEMAVSTRWAGGQTNEYIIMPEGSSYKERNFTFRVSTASIEKEPSFFTSFKGYNRYLVMLDNALNCVRNGYAEHYKKHEVFCFKSSDSIESFTKGNDFNLMIKEDIKAKADIYTEQIVHFDTKHILLFALETGNIEVNNNVIELSVTDCVYIETSKGVDINLCGKFFSAAWNV